MPTGGFDLGNFASNGFAVMLDEKSSLTLFPVLRRQNRSFPFMDLFDQLDNTGDFAFCIYGVNPRRFFA